MSKSKGNVVDPLDVVEKYGADVLRTYILFMGDYGQATPWSDNSVKGCKRFLDRVWGLNEIVRDGKGYTPSMETAFHQTIKKVSSDYDAIKFNTAIAALMTLINRIYDEGSLTKKELSDFLILLNPVAPHMTEEMWEMNGFDGMLCEQKWVEYDEAKTVESTIEIPVSVCGKLRGVISVPADADKDTVIAAAKADEKVQSFISGKTIVKEIFVPGRMVNIVVK